ncbi:MAG: phosphatidylglycerophosphatase A [Proteobacteria bacterium]|nr:phosphatidylglycerophosphatase A [Pseudomonadota bacterium]
MYLSVIARFFATAGGVGYSPIGPGTCGTAVAVPLAWITSGFPLWLFAAMSLAIIVVGIWAASAADAHWGSHDSGRIVIDEVAGYLVTVSAVDRSDWVLLVLGFVLFRVFDIVKPPPVRWLDRNIPGGTGVVIDDVAAGVLAGAVLYGFSISAIAETL